jgi:hypothetical protein
MKSDHNLGNFEPEPEVSVLEKYEDFFTSLRAGSNHPRKMSEDEFRKLFRKFQKSKRSRKK